MKTIFYVVNPASYNDFVLDVLKKDLRSKLVYVSAMKSYREFSLFLEENKVSLSRFFFLDCVTSHLRKEEESSNCLFLGSENDMADLCVVTYSLLKHWHGEKVLFFDAAVTFTLCNDPKLWSNFISHFILERATACHVKLVLTSLESDEDRGLIEMVSRFFDEVKTYGN